MVALFRLSAKLKSSFDFLCETTNECKVTVRPNYSHHHRHHRGYTGWPKK